MARKLLFKTHKFRYFAVASQYSRLNESVRKIMKSNSSMMLKMFLPLALISNPLALWANGYLLPDQDAFATARGEAFVATADNASAVYYNPAGLSQLNGNNVRAGAYGIYLDPRFTPPGGSQTFHSARHYAATPQLFYSYGRTNWPVSFGLGVYSPFGLAVDWPQNTGFRTLGVQGRLTTVTINPVMAVKLSPSLSIGGGIMINYANINLQQGYPFDPFPSADLFEFKADGWDVGYNLGVMWKPIEQVSLGATFRSAATMNFSGHTETIYPAGTTPYSSSASASWPFPLEAAFGISYRPTSKWNVEFDADYTDWSALGTVNINQSTPPPVLPLSQVPETLNWQSSWLYKFGVTRYFDNGWHVSAGYVYNENSVPNANYSPLVADLARHFFSVGTGHAGKLFDFDVAYQFCYGPTHTVSGSETSYGGQTADGNYKFNSQAVILTVGMHF
jgi:long-chain fatty acid transport protein